MWVSLEAREREEAARQRGAQGQAQTDSGSAPAPTFLSRDARAGLLPFRFRLTGWVERAPHHAWVWMWRGVTSAKAANAHTEQSKGMGDGPAAQAGEEGGG